MAHSFRLLPVLGLTVALAAACDRAPTGPEIDDVAALLSISNPSATANSRIFNNTLPALFRESISRVEAQQGRQAVELLLADWRDHQEKLKTEAPGASRAAVQARLAAIHDEEIRVVQRVLGGHAVTRMISEANVALNDAKAQIAAAAANGKDMESARSVAANAAARVKDARLALTVSDSHEALEQASQAATLVAGLRYYLIETRRVHGLESLFPQAVARLNAQGMVDDPALRDLEKLNARIRSALKTSNRRDAHTLLGEARSAQIAIVLRALGTGTVTRLIEMVDERAIEVVTYVDAVKTSGRDAIKLERMLHEAQDMSARAHAALEKGDAATALDLGSHAAGLLNAVQHLTWQ